MNPAPIILDEQTAATIRQLASQERRSETEVVRDALALYARTGPRPLPVGVGKYRSGSHDVAQQAGALIRDAVKEGRWP
ncbi:MAG: ribbon-helix-helix protein, CopG family [Isosphaeraceae bacterium]